MEMTLPWRNRPENDPAPPRRGAVPTPVRRQQPTKVEANYKKPLLLLTVLIVFLAICYMAGRDLMQWLDRPVTQVEITGNTRHLDKQAVAHELAAQIDQPLFGIDLPDLQKKVISIPWIHDASVSRQWPPAIRINVVEEVPVARWGDKGLLNHQGDIFWPELKPEYLALPRLSGPAHETVQIMEQFHDLNRMFANTGIQLQGLTLEPRGAWSLKLSNGIEVIAGREHLVERLRRFLVIYQQDLAAKADQIRQVDIRYTNGVAVQWKEPENNSSDAG